jgi:catechol 2,3-dioxygenase-like lactoylglutathione lyase family enzyme
MLSEYPPVPTLAVTDLERARAFYEGTLRFTTEDDVPDGVLYRSGDGSFLVYPSSYAGTNKATAMSFQVPGTAFDGEVAALREAGIEFQTFDMDGMEWDDGVAVMGPMRAVWFADPDGNILNLETSG